MYNFLLFESIFMLVPVFRMKSIFEYMHFKHCFALRKIFINLKVNPLNPLLLYAFQQKRRKWGYAFGIHLRDKLKHSLIKD